MARGDIGMRQSRYVLLYSRFAAKGCSLRSESDKVHHPYICDGPFCFDYACVVVGFFVRGFLESPIELLLLQQQPLRQVTHRLTPT